MAKHMEPILKASPTNRVLLMAEDPWLRFRLQRELERAGCDVVALARLRGSDLSAPLCYDVVLADAALFPEGSRLEALRALRHNSPAARFVLLVARGELEIATEACRGVFDLVLERPSRVESLPELVEQVLGEARPTLKVIPVSTTFEVLIEAPQGMATRHAGTAMTSLVVHGVALALALVVPLIYTETLDIRELTQTWLVAPPPPPPPPPPAPKTELVQARRVKPVLQTLTGKLVTPTVIPKEITRIVEPTDVEMPGTGVLGGVPGGVPGGTLGGVIGGVIASTQRPLMPPPPRPQAPVRVGGRVRPPQLIRRVEPDYPSIARQARIQGDVRIDAIIDTNGRVVEMKVLSGHPLLVQAALDGVRQWVYEPTYLNEQPIRVVLEVTVNFRLM